MRYSRGRNMLLLVASYFFYMNWKAEYALLLLTSTIITYEGALYILKFQKKKGLLLFLTIGSNLVILFFFKYYQFAADNITALMSCAGMKMNCPHFDVLLPVGISFYTFQAIGYTIDVYKGKVLPERDFFTYALFVSFFPQLVAGPIERSTNLLKQFYEKHPFRCVMALQGLGLMVWGYFLKLVLAERCAIYVDAIFNNIAHHNGASFLLASFFFSFQIYGDFAGYTFIAIGCARIMGFRLVNNFMRPNLFSKSIDDFWKRWHISLTNWFREYLYFPLGGNRKGKARKVLNTMIVFLVSGLWHGANWNFILWGGLHGIWLSIYSLIRPKKSNACKRNVIGTVLNCCFTTIGVCLIWITFRVHSILDIGTVFTGILFNMGRPFLDFNTIATALLAIAIVFFKEFNEEYRIKYISKKNDLLYVFKISVMIILILLFGVFDGGQFIYFQF